MESKLSDSTFKFLKMKEIKPEGWLLNQLTIQACGLSGNLDKFWPDIKDSQWIGGLAEGWERVPYWLDGFIPLSWLLDNEDMKKRAILYINYIIENQTPDGWICPDNHTDIARYDMWALFLILKVLVLYEDATGDNRIEEVVRKALIALDKHIDSNTIFNWAHTRWFEATISIWWLYERTGEDWLISLASKLHCQGFDWQSFFKIWPYKTPDIKGRWSQMSHAVNNAMMLKSGALLWKMTKNLDDLNSSEEMVKLLDKYHGTVTGVFTGDECLDGNSPIQGTELCAVVEYMYSLEHLIAISGRSHWGDRLEKIAFNALPAMFSPDMWTHQYDQQVNQVQCSKQEASIFSTNAPDAHTFGLEHNYGCCTANLSQAWPKLALSAFMRSSDGFVATTYIPCSINTTLSGVNVSIRLETSYPFSDILSFKVVTQSDINFSIGLRIPAWTENAFIKLDNKTIPVKSGSFHKLNNIWKNETNFTLKLPMKLNILSRPNNLYAISYGPLIYSLPIGENWVRVNKDISGREFPHCDYEIYPTTPWNYGLCIDKSDIESSFEYESNSVGDCPFSPSGAPVCIKVKGRKVDWGLEKSSAAPFPRMEWVSDKVEELRLIPYGCTNLRITEMPIV